MLGVDGLGIADEPPGPDFPVHQLPKLTTRMVARIQGFPDTWEFSGRKTAAYRQVGNAFPPPVARALGVAIRRALEAGGPAPHATDLGHHASLAAARPTDDGRLAGAGRADQGEEAGVGEVDPGRRPEGRIELRWVESSVPTTCPTRSGGSPAVPSLS